LKTYTFLYHKRNPFCGDTMNKVLFMIISLLVLAVGCTSSDSATDVEQDIVEEDVRFCTADYRPVCGTDGQTYSNACVASSVNAIIAYEGECQAVVLAQNGGSIRIPASTLNALIDVQLQVGEIATIDLYNDRDESVRVSIPQLAVSEDLLANTQQTILVTPSIEGYYPVEINGAQVGTIQVE